MDSFKQFCNFLSVLDRLFCIVGLMCGLMTFKSVLSRMRKNVSWLVGMGQRMLAKGLVRVKTLQEYIVSHCISIVSHCVSYVSSCVSYVSFHRPPRHVNMTRIDPLILSCAIILLNLRLMTRLQALGCCSK